MSLFRTLSNIDMGTLPRMVYNHTALSDVLGQQEGPIGDEEGYDENKGH